ncbi:MAG: efflux RND transporter permease subunit [Polyangiaceae bacterium]
MQWLAAVCVKRPVFATVIALLLTVVGIFSYFGLGIDRFPRIDFPIVTVTTIVPGAAPEQVETDVSDKIEESVNTISGIEELRSVSAEGVSQVFITFVLEKDVNIASQEVTEKVNAIVNSLPTGVERPTIMKIDPDATPVLTLVVSGPGSVRDVTEVADKKIKRELESIAGVGDITIIGGRARQINIWIKPEKLEAKNISPLDVERALRAQNIELPSGRVEAGSRQLTLRTLGRVESVEALGEIAVATRDNVSIRLKEVADVADEMAQPASAGFQGSSSAVLLSIRKQSGTNTLEVVKKVKERLKEASTLLPEGYGAKVARDQSEFIGNAIGAVKEHLVLGALLAAIVVFLFLSNARTTIISAVAIPVSIIATFGLMNVAGFTLNSLTMLALTLAVGIVIDDAIVVLENIYRYIEEKGMDPKEAAIQGTKEIGLAVLATTLSLIVVFMPVAFMAGIVGRFMNSFGLTMAFAIGVSLIVSFVLTPMMASRMLKKKVAKFADGKVQPVEHGKSGRVYGAIEAGYMRVLGWSLRHRWVIVIACLATLGSCMPLGQMANKNFLPDEDESQFAVSMRAPEGLTLDATRIIATRLASEIESMPGVAYAITTIGDDVQQTPNLANLYVKLVPPTERKQSQLELVVEARKRVQAFAERRKAETGEDLRTSIGPVPAFSGGPAQAAVQMQLQGQDLKKLEVYTFKLLDVLRNTPGTVDADSSLVVGKPELRVRIDRAKSAELGVNVADIASALRLLVGGYEVGNYAEGGEQYDIFVRSVGDARNDVERLKRLTVPSLKLGTVTLDSIVEFSEGTGPSRIDRYNRRKTVILSCNLQPGVSQQKIVDTLNAAAKSLNMEPGYSLNPLGQSKELGKAMNNFLLAFALSFIFMYLVLAAQFESWLHPITILLSLPLTVPFALLSVVIFKQSLNIFSMLGVLVLFGVVKKNSILQVDHTINLRKEGMERNQAILLANKDRLRPILMTTVAFVAGMIPLVFSSGAGAGTNRATGFVIIGGQTMSLLLTLLATPIAYSLFDDLGNVFKRKPKATGMPTGDAPPALNTTLIMPTHGGPGSEHDPTTHR